MVDSNLHAAGIELNNDKASLE